MIRQLLILSLLFILFSCKESGTDQKESNSKEVLESDSKELEKQDKTVAKADTIKAPADFSAQGFDEARKYELLIETRICNPQYSDSTKDGTVPCSAKYFRFFEYNRKRTLDNAFMLQVKAGVNNIPYRRLLIFEREKGKLVLVNGVIGYLVSQIKRPNGIDDLIVGVIDDLGDNNFDRYDVLLRYKDGKYHIVEAVGDLQGEFKSEELKKRATKMIKERIAEKELIY
tara:strand:- start:4908 stop:5591 length:684 start_codon:yes stop_codon:yes gene_type:complete